MKFAIVCAVFVMILASGDCSAEYNILGRGFYLPEKDIFSPLHGGASLVKPLHCSCYKWENVRVSSDQRSTFKDTSSFYSKIASDSSLNIGLRGPVTMGVTLGVKTKSMSPESVSVTGTSVEIRAVTKATYLDDDCIIGSNLQLSDDVIEMFDNLPSTIQAPKLRGSWHRYDTFLRTFGTHIVKKSYHGAVVRQWTFSKTSSRYTIKELNIRSCLDLNAGPLSLLIPLNVSACSGIAKSEAESVKNLEMSNYLEIYGGSDETRNDFRISRCQDDLNRLLLEGLEMQSPIAYEYLAVWDLLKRKFHDHPERYAKAITMMQYYHGFKDFGCTHQISEGVDLRAFRYSQDSTPELPKFKCHVKNQGCHSDADCHFIIGEGLVSYCQGKTCYEYSQPFGSKAISVSPRMKRKGNHDEGVNRSCKKDWLFDGYCDKNFFRSLVIWSSDGEGYSQPALYRRSRQLVQENSACQIQSRQNQGGNASGLSNLQGNRGSQVKYSTLTISVFLILFLMMYRY